MHKKPYSLYPPNLGRMGPRGLGDLGRMTISFRELGRTGNYFRGSGEKANSFGDLGSPAKT